MNTESTPIDSYIVPLLKHLWDMGVETYFSCAGHEGRYDDVYLVFKYDESFVKYLAKHDFSINISYNDLDDRVQVHCQPWEFEKIAAYNNGQDDFLLLMKEDSKKVKDRKINSKLIRDHFLAVLASYLP